MKRATLVAVVCALAALVGCALPSWALPVPWTNGHWYETFSTENGISWTDAEAAAEGMGGYLVTLTSAEENAFVFGLIPSGLWTGLILDSNPVYGPWIGGFQAPGSDEPGGGWQWVNNEGSFDATYSNWLLGGAAPNNKIHSGITGPEDYAHFMGPPGDVNAGHWNDLWDEQPVKGYIVEYNGDPSAVPEPASCALLALAVGGIGAMLRRRRK